MRPGRCPRPGRSTCQNRAGAKRPAPDIPQPDTTFAVPSATSAVLNATFPVLNATSAESGRGPLAAGAATAPPCGIDHDKSWTRR